MYPTFAIIGAQKSATTFLQRLLQSHPDIFLPDGELATFEDPQYADYDPEIFASHFRPGQDAEAVGLKRPNYLHEPVVPERLAKHLPDIKLIISLRDPVDRAVSAYFHQVRQNFAPLVDVNRGLEDILEGRWTEVYPRTSQIISYGRYYEQVERYLEWFDRSDFFITTYQSLTTQPKDTIRKLQKFLGVSNIHLSDIPEASANVGTYSGIRLRIVRLSNRIRFEYFHDGQRLRPKSQIGVFERIAVRLLRGVNQWVLKYIESGQPSLRPGIRDRLISYYRDDAEHLRVTFDLDVGHWSVFGDVE